MAASMLAVLVAATMLAALARRFDVSAPLALVIAGLAASTLPGLKDVALDPELVLYVILPPLLWSAGSESSYVALRKHLRPISLLAVGLPLVTTFAVGIVAFQVVPELTLAAAFTLGAIVAPPDAVSATAVGRRLGLPRRIMTLLGGESLFNDATALTAYKVALGAAIGIAGSWESAARTFALAAVGGVALGMGFGALISAIRSRLDDPVVESAIGLLAPFGIYFVTESVHGSGVIAVVVAALILGQRSAYAGYATRLQDFALWQSVVLILESFAFLLIGLQLPRVIAELHGIPATVLIVSSAAVFATVIVVRLVWMYLFAYVPRLVWRRLRESEPALPPSQVFILGWAGMRGVVSLAAAAAVPLTTLSGAPFPGRPHVMFLTFVVVVGTLLLHGLTLPWVIRRLHVRGDDPEEVRLAAERARDRATRAASDRLDELLADAAQSDLPERASEILKHWNTRRIHRTWDRLSRPAEELGEDLTASLHHLLLEMLAAERKTYIEERDAGRIDDETLRTMLRSLDFEEATLNSR